MRQGIEDIYEYYWETFKFADGRRDYLLSRMKANFISITKLEEHERQEILDAEKQDLATIDSYMEKKRLQQSKLSDEQESRLKDYVQKQI